MELHYPCANPVQTKPERLSSDSVHGILPRITEDVATEDNWELIILWKAGGILYLFKISVGIKKALLLLRLGVTVRSVSVTRDHVACLPHWVWSLKGGI